MDASFIATVLRTLRNRPVREMNNDQLAKWLKTCRALQPLAWSLEARRMWNKRLADAEAEHRRRWQNN